MKQCRVKPCCESLEDMVAQRGTRGFPVELPGESSDDPFAAVPTMVFRGYDAADAEQVHIEAAIPVSVEGQLGFRFCPWCGKELAG